MMADAELDWISERLNKMKADSARLNQELDQVKRSKRRLTLVSAAFGAAALIALMAGAMQPAKVVEAQGFNMLGLDGKPRIKLATLSKGEPFLGFGDSQGTGRLELKINGNGTPLVALRDDEGDTRVTMIVAADDTAELGFLDADGKARLGLNLAPDGKSQLYFQNSDRFVRALIKADRHGVPSMSLHDPNGRERLAMRLAADFSPVIHMTNQNQKTSILTVTKPDGSSVLGLWSAEDKVVFQAPPLPPQP